MKGSIRLNAKDVNTLVKELECLLLLGEISQAMKSLETIKKLNKLLIAIQLNEKCVAEEIEKMRAVLENNISEISKIIVGMQFQDRVSQNIMITNNVMKTISDFLDRTIEHFLEVMI